MAQRLTQLFRMFYGIESTEGTEVLGTASEAFLTVGPPSWTLSKAVHLRKLLGQFGAYTSKVGHQPDPALSFTCELRNRGATSNAVEIADLFQAVMGTETVGTGDTTTTGTPTTTVIDTVDASGISVDDAVAIETATANVYEVGWVKSISSNELTLHQALSFTPAASKKVKSGTTYKLAGSGHQFLSFQMWLDSTDYVSLLGSMGSLKIDAPETGTIPTVSFDWKGQGWTHTTSGTRPAQTFLDTGVPPVSLATVLKIDGSKVDVRSFSFDLGQQVSRKMSQNSTYGTTNLLVTDRNPTWSTSIYNVDQTYFTNRDNGTELGIEHQWGNTQYNMVALQLENAQITDASYGDDSGLATTEISGTANIDAGNDEFRIAFL